MAIYSHFETPLWAIFALSWLRLAQSCTRVWDSRSPIFHPSPFTFTSVRFVLWTVDFLCLLWFSRLFTLPRCYLRYLSYISNSVTVSAFGMTQTNRKKNECLCVLFIEVESRAQKSCNLIIFHMLPWVLYYCYPACSTFPISCLIKACSEINLGLWKTEILYHKSFLL